MLIAAQLALESDHAGESDHTGVQVTAPPGSGVMFVEINYLTKPLFGSFLVSPTRIHYIASFIVRDSRDYKQLYNPSPGATQMTCDKYTA